MRALLAIAACLSTSCAAAAPWWAAPVVSFWIAPNGGDYVNRTVALVAAHASEVTSVMAYCGIDILDDGRLITPFSAACSALFPPLRALGVRTELVTNSGNCSIAAMRLLWADVTTAPAQLLAAALASGADGINIDFEPQADACQGGPTGDAADAALFAAWLAAVRAQLAPHGVRLTVDVAAWSPVLSQYAVLAAGVDRLLTMETYNGDSPAAWSATLDAYVAAAPLAAAGVGLGAWSDGKGQWWETPAAGPYKVNASRAARVPELAVFRIVPAPNASPAWPLDFWWPALQAFLAPEGAA